MQAKELNIKLIENLPELIEKYLEETEWQEGDCTGSHIVYGDVLKPYLISCIEQNKTNDAKRVFEFLENLLCTKDEYADEVVALSVFSGMISTFNEYSYSLDSLGENSKIMLSNFL